MFIISPIFPLLLSFIIFTAYKVIDNPFTLCDNGCPPLLLGQLEANLGAEMNNTSKISSNLLELNKTMKEITESSKLTTADKENYKVVINTLRRDLVKSLERCNEIEVSIQKINPNFTSGLMETNARTIRNIQESIRR